MNITRDEYDKQRNQLLLQDDDMPDQVDEYHQFSIDQPDEMERRETVILNHGKVISTFFKINFGII